MIIVVPINAKLPFNKEKFVVNTVMYKSLSGDFYIISENLLNRKFDEFITVDNIQFRWYKYKNCIDEWELIP